MLDVATVGYAFCASCVVFPASIVVIYLMYLFFVHRKFDHLPGPKRTSFLFGNALEIRKLACSGSEKWSECAGKKPLLNHLLATWHAQHGQTFVIFILHRTFVVTMDADLLKLVLVHGDPHIFTKFDGSSARRILGVRFLGHGLASEVNHDAWYLRRKTIDPAFHRKKLMTAVDGFNLSADKLASSLQKLADSGTEVLLAPHFHNATLDVIMRAAFSIESDSISPKLKELLVDVFKISFESMEAVFASFFPQINPFLWKYKSKLNKLLPELRRTGERLIRERLAAMKSGEVTPDDILDTMVLAMIEHPKEYSLEIAVDDFVTFFVAGTETSANALAFLFMELGRQPHMRRRLQAEVDAVIGSKSYVSPDDVSKLTYCGQLIKETLRIYPVVPLILRQLQQEVKHSGTYLPKGTLLMVNIYASNRNPDLVENATKFDPDRFGAESEKRVPAYSFLSFSLGARNCIGQVFAQVEMKVIMAKFVQHFTYQLAESERFIVAQRATLIPLNDVRCQLASRATAG